MEMLFLAVTAAGGVAFLFGLLNGSFDEPELRPVKIRERDQRR